METTISLTVNGTLCERTVPTRLLLVDFIRDHLGLTGTHVGCTYEGRCGACTVVLDGEAVKSCMVLAAQADGASLMTVEGLEQLAEAGEQLHPIQKAFWECHGLQCGYCTPGMMMTIFDLLRAHNYDEGAELDELRIRRALVGNICRCTGYSHIVDAVKMAAHELAAMPSEQRAACLAVAPCGGAQ